MKKAEVQRTQSFAGPLSQQAPTTRICNEAEVQRMKSFAGVRGVPEKSLFLLLPPQVTKEETCSAG